jgi:hypothetical protein
MIAQLAISANPAREGKIGTVPFGPLPGRVIWLRGDRAVGGGVGGPEGTKMHSRVADARTYGP